LRQGDTTHEEEHVADSAESSEHRSDPWDPWNFRDRFQMATKGRSIVGFTVHATDGHIGKVDKATTDVDSSHIVVDTGPWIFGERVLLPAGTVIRIDWEDRAVYLDISKDQIRAAPSIDHSVHFSTASAEEMAQYYRDTYGL
jgi:hypothetical protein